MALFMLKIAPATLFNPLVTDEKPALVLSTALIEMRTSWLAIVLAYDLEVGQPLVEFTNGYLLNFSDCLM
jgi:hypothetical protein